MALVVESDDNTPQAKLKEQRMNNYNVSNQDSQKHIKRQSYIIVLEDNKLALFINKKEVIL